MNKKFKVIFSISSIALLTGCSLEANPSGAAIMTAVNYEGEQRIVYTLDDDFSTPVYEDPVTGVKRGGRHINKGDYKPVWSALQDRLKINLLEHQPAANSGTKKSVDYFRDNWMTKTHADISMGTVYDINNYSVAGNNETILDLKPYIEETEFIPDPKNPEQVTYNPDNPGPLPHIATFLENNPGVKMSIITAKHSHPDQGAIYYVPYFDGFDEIDKSPIMRADYVRRLLDDDPSNTDQRYKFSETKGIIKPHGTAGEKIYTQNYAPLYVESDEIHAPAYSFNVPIKVGDAYEVKTFSKNRTENIIYLQNKSINEGDDSSKTLAEQFRDYIDKRYGEPGTPNSPLKKYSDLFIGYNACYDSDELVALMRLVKVSSGTLFKVKDDKGNWNEVQKEMVTWMPRTCDNQRSSDLYRWAGQAFGVRGTESRNSNLYMYISGEKDYSEYGYGKYGKVHDACGDEGMLKLLQILRSLYQEGLILQDFDSKTATGTSEGKFADETLFSGGGDKFAGFMVYDWARDLNDFNKYATADRKTPCDWKTLSPNGDPFDPKKPDGEKGYPYGMQAVVGAIAQWDIDGDGTPDGADEGGFMPFTESWTSLKTSALCLNARLAKNDERRAATFKLIDYIFSDEGTYLYNYGPWEEGYITQLAGDGGETWTPDLEKGDPKVDYIEFQGKKFPRLTPNALTEYMGTTEGVKAKTGYQRRFIGACIPFGFRKLSAVGYQTMEQKTRDGMDVVNKAIQLETFKHVLIGAKTEKEKKNIKTPFYQICPSAFFLTKGQSSAISNLLDKNKLGSIFTDSSTSNFNIWDALVMGQDARGGVTFNNYIETMKKWGIEKIENYYQSAFEIMSEPLE